MTDTATQKGAAEATHENLDSGVLQTEDDVANAFLDNWKDPDEASDQGTEEDGEQDGSSETDTQDPADESDHDDQDAEDEADPDAEADDEDGEDGEDEGDEEAQEVTEADDDAVVTLKVDGEERQVPVKDLKRLAGQEAALTRKSQEVAAQRKAAEGKQQEHAAALATLLDRAMKRFEPYSKLDMIEARHQLDEKSYAQLKADRDAAEADVTFLQQEVEGLVGKMRETHAATQKEAAKKAVETLTDAASPLHIADWGNEVYDNIRGFAIDMGFDAEVVNNETNPVALKILHMAMLYQKGQKKVATKKRIKATPKKVLKGKQNSVITSRNTRRSQAVEKARKSGGEEEDIANAFLAGWQQ